MWCTSFQTEFTYLATKLRYRVIKTPQTNLVWLKRHRSPFRRFQWKGRTWFPNQCVLECRNRSSQWHWSFIVSTHTRAPTKYMFIHGWKTRLQQDHYAVTIHSSSGRGHVTERYNHARFNSSNAHEIFVWGSESNVTYFFFSVTGSRRGYAPCTSVTICQKALRNWSRRRQPQMYQIAGVIFQGFFRWGRVKREIFQVGRTQDFTWLKTKNPPFVENLRGRVVSPCLTETTLKLPVSICKTSQDSWSFACTL